MRRLIAAMVVGAGLLSGLGCMGKAEYVQKNKDGGIIALKIGADEAEARKLMEKHMMGSNYEVVDKYDPKSKQQLNTPPKQTTLAGIFSPKEEGVIYIAYRKRADSNFGGSTPAGLPPAPKDTGLIQSGRQTKPLTANGPQTEFGSDPGTVTPPAMFPTR